MAPPTGRPGCCAIFIVLFLAGILINPAQSGFIRFKPDTEYIYTFHSSTELKNVRTLHVESKIGFILVKNSNHSTDQQQQEVYLNVHSAAVTSGDLKDPLNEERDFSEWFSFDVDANGAITHVYYPRDESNHVIGAKKGLTSILASNLQHPPENEVNPINGWNYDCNETGHEGHHEASYSAKMAPGNDGIIVFTKTRRTHPIPYGKSSHQKEIHYHPGMQLPTIVKIVDQFDAPRESVPGFEHKNKWDDAEGDYVELPEMQSSSQGQLTFIRQVYHPSPTTPPADEDLVTDSIHITAPPNNHLNFNTTELKEFIFGNLTCMRNAPLKGSRQQSMCFEDLVETLRAIPDTLRLAQIVTPVYKLPLSKRGRDKEDRLNLLDAITGIHTDASQSLLADMILLSPRPNKELVERLLIASAGFVHTVSQHYLETVEDIVFQPGRFPSCMRETEIQRVAVLALGALAGNLWKTGQKAQAEKIVVNMEDRLGVHDPWAYDKTLTSLTDIEQDDFHHDTVAWIEALGNAGLHRSFPHIQSYTNSSMTHPLLKRAGLHSLRDYHHDMAAEVLLKSALDENEDTNVRYEASLLYKDHPHGGYENVSKLINTEGYSGSNSSHDLMTATEVTSLPSRHRVRRGFFEEIKFKLASPSVDWKKTIGSSQTGSRFGVTVRNQLDMSIAPLSGFLRVDLYDEAYATILVGLVGEKVDIARARFCFNGHIEYNLNILQEFGVERLNDLAKAYDIVIGQVVGNVVRGVDIVVGLFNGDVSINQLFDQFVQTLEEIPQRIGNVRSVSTNAVARLSRFDPDQLPPSIRGVINVVNKAAQLFSDIKTDVMEFYQAVNEAITVTLPWAAEQIWDSINLISDTIGMLLESPLKAVGDIFKGVLNIKTAVDAVLEARMEVEEANFFKEGQRPYWFDLPKVIGDMLKELRDHLKNIRSDLATWVNEVKSADDPIKKLTGGAIDTETLRREVQAEIEAIIDELIGPIEPIENLLAPFFELYDLVFNTIEAIKEAYQTLKDGYQKSQALVMKLFGPKAHASFPRKYREPGSGSCQTGGFYPTNSGGRYTEQGVDLEMPQGTPLVAPFSGLIYRSPGKPNQVTLEARGGAFRNIKIFIDNITPNSTLSETRGVNVIAGTRIGTVVRSTSCTPPNYIHFSMKTSQPNRLAALLDSSLNDEPTPSDEAAKEGYVDPTNYLAKRPLEIPKWIQVCDDYKMVWQGRTVKEGSLLNRDNKNGQQKDTSPSRKTSPSTTTTRPDTSKRPPKPTSSLGSAVSKENKEKTKEALDLPEPKIGSGSPFKNFTLRNLKIGSILAFARKLGLEETADALLTVVKTIVKLVSDKPCVLPESLTSDSLRIELQQRGLSAQGDRKELLQRYKQPEDRCPLLQVSLPKNVYCKIDQSCLGVECCMNIKLFMVSLAFKAFMRFDPCEFQFVLGVNSWNYTLQILDAEFGQEVDVPVPFDIPFVDDMELHLRFGIEKTRTQLLASMSVGFCPTVGDADCLPFIDVLKDSAIPLPICHPNGTFTWPDIDLDDYFSRAALKKLIKDTGEELLKAGAEAALNYVLEELGIPKEFLEGKDPCPTPTSLSNTQLTAALEERQLAVIGTRMDQEASLSLDDRTCQFFTLPAFSPEVAKVAYCSLTENCLRLDCCLELNIERFKFRRSFKAFVEVDACDFTFYLAFQHLQYKKLLLSYNWGQPEQQQIGAITLSYSIDKLDADKVFEIDFGAAICPSGEDCIFDIEIVKDYRVPIPFCNSNFSFALPGGDTLKDFVEQVGRNAAQEAVNILLEYIGLRDKITDGPCGSTAPPTGEKVCTALTLPSLPSTVTCDLSDRCLGVRCCVELDLKITVLSANMWFMLDPCEFTLTLGFGLWSLKFTIFDYHWGTQEEIKIGSALTVFYTIDKLTEEKVFVLDLALSVCLPESECDTPSIDILKGTRVPIPLCNENATFALPGDGSIKGFLQMVGQNAADSAIDAILEYLGLADYISREPCVRPQVTQNGWNRICPRDVKLPPLPKNFICTLPEKCLGFDCCLELPIPGIAPISTSFSFIFDPCNYVLSMSLGSWSKDLKIFSYQWGQLEELTVGTAITFSITIDKLDAIESFQINLDIKICIDDDCTVTPVLQDSLIPIPFCNLNASFTLPGDGSFAGLARDLAGNVGELAIQAGLRRLGIQQYVSNQDCDMEILAPSENKCPLLRAPRPTNILTCTIDDRCLGVTCCAALDLIFTQLSTTAYAVLDPCEFRLSVGLGLWSHNVTLFEDIWGVERTLKISDSVQIIFNIDKLTEQKEFLVDLSVILCIDSACNPITLLQGAHIPIPICNPNATLTLPGDGTIAGYLADLGGQVTDAAIDLVLEYLGLKSFVSKDPCSLPPALPSDSNTCPVQFPTTLAQLSCRIDGLCTSLHCCLTLDLKVTQLSSRAWLEIDACDYKLSVGLERWFYNISLFSYEWGNMESFMIGDAISVRFSIDKLDASKEYEVDLSFSLLVDGITTDFPIMTNERIPIPICNANFSLTLPGDGTVKGFLEELGDNVGQAAIQLVLQKLNLQDIISGRSCELPSAVATNNHCPQISLPFLQNVIQCSIDDRCLAMQCCVHLDFIITSLSLSAKIEVDPCDFWLYVAFENWERNLTLFSYPWGQVETVPIGDGVTLSYSVDKLTDQKVFSVTLNIGLCIDDTCTTTPVLDHVWVPIPLCNTNASAFTLPGDGTVAGFIQELGGRIGNAAIDLVLEKFGLSEYLESSPCDRGTPGTLRSSCPAVHVGQLPDFLSCTVTDTCLGIRCCLEMDLKITTRSVNAWIILDPCNFNLSIGFEKWEYGVTLFHYPLGDVREEIVNDVLSVRWRVAKITEDKQFEIDLSLVFCVDGLCDVLTVFKASRLPIPLCNTEDAFTLPGDGTVSGFLSYLGGNIGQFAVDAALRHLKLKNFLTGRACTFQSQDVCASVSSPLGNCSIIGETCTELRCCLDLDLKIADVSATAWFKFDPCDFTFSLGLEKWSFHGSVFSYVWGTVMTEPIASGMNLRYSINKLDDTKEFALNMNLEYCIDGLCTDIDIQQKVPIPICNPAFTNYTLSVDGFIETVTGQVIEGASLALLSQLGIDPDFFSSQPCVNPNGTQSFGNCPKMQLPSALNSLAHCGILDTCFGVRCCLDLNLGPLHHSFSASLDIDPCIGQMKLQFGNWQYVKSLSHLDFDTSKEITIGNFVTLRYTLALMNSQISISLSVDACVDGHCTGEIALLDGAVSPLPTCYPNGTVSWRNLPGITSISQLGSLDVGFEAVAQALGLPSHLISASPCPPVLLASQSGVCPHLPPLPTLGSGGVCHYSDACLGVECCLVADLGIISRTVRAWLIVDPCDFKLSVGFENWSYNVTLLSYKWGKVTREKLSEAVSLTFTIDKTADNRNFLLSLSVQLCIAGVCAPDIAILEGFSAPIPFCNPDGTLEWAQDLAGNIGDYASGLVVNRLEVSIDVLLPQACSGPPEQIAPRSTGCGPFSVPTAIASYCYLDDSCLGVGCCLNFDLGIVQRSFSVWVKLDPCARTFSFGFERWSHTEALGIQLLQSHSFEKMIGVIKIRYDIERPHTKVYDVDLDISLCWKGECDEPIVILRDAMFSGSHCVDGTSGGGDARRKRRSVADLTSESEEKLENVEDLTFGPIDKARAYFKDLLAKGSSKFGADDNTMVQLQPENKVMPMLPDSGTASRRSMGLLVFGDEDETPISRRRRRDLTLSATSGGASLFDLSLTPGADSGTWQGDTIIGGGLTLKGLDALGQRIANMTIGELEAMLDLQNIDPFTVVQLMKDLRSLFRTFVEEFIDVVTSGIAEDAFNQFDIVLSGTVPFPRRNAVFFRYIYQTSLGGLIWLEFTVTAGGFFDNEIPVSVSLVQMQAVGGVTPMVGANVRATVAVCYGPLCGELELLADVMHTSFPTVAEISFSKFPLDVGLKLDIEMIPLTLLLRGKVTIKIPFFGKKTLYKKDLWRYQASKISGNIFYYSTKDPDTSPPEIAPYSSADEQPSSGPKCGVEQVYGLDYTEPAFQLEMVAADDKSLVTFEYQVGTSLGGNDVLSKTEFGGPSAIISQTLLGGRALHFTVYAMNNGGGTSTATCSLPTFDVTLPTGRITPDFTSTSHPGILRASAVIYDDSVILMQKEAVGFGVDVWGDQIVPWNTIDITERQHLGSSVNDFDYFTAAKKGRLISKPISTITHRNANFCARDCLALPETKCLSINYDYGDFTCELLEEIEGHGVEVHESGLFSHFERLGIGHAVEFNHESLQLIHNNLYNFNIELLNFVGYENIIPSVGIIADFTPPAPGFIANAARDETVREPCSDFTPDEWERRCIEDTPLDNHRYLVDGAGSMTVFNGHEELVDMLYTRSNTFMAANWDGFHDNETGIHGYTWSIGNSLCNDDVSMHIDPHAHLFDESEWTHQGLVVNINLPDGPYYITVRALNKVEFGGPMALSVCHSTPLIIDNTPPIIYSIYDITYDSKIGRIGLYVNATDPDSYLYGYHIAAGRTPRDISLRDWEAHELAEQLFMNFQIPNGIPCWMKVRAVNNVDLRTIDSADEPILVDDTPPITGDLFDGSYAGRDLVYTKDRNQICANWHNWYDPESGIFAYQLAYGTRPGLNNVMDYVSISRREHSGCSDYVTLQHGETYYATLVAIHGGYDKLNASSSSNGVTVDLTPPVQGSVYDGILPGPTDLDFSSRPATVATQWQGFSDPESGIEDYEITVYRKHDGENTTSEFEVIHEAEGVGKDTSLIEWHHFHLQHKDRVYVNLRTINQALNHIDTPTNGFLIDLTPPMLRTLGDGLVVGQDADFQSHSDSLAVHWDYFDDESGIESFELAIYEMRQGNKIKIFPADSNPNSFEEISDATTKSHVQTGLALRGGSIYITRIKARNQAKLIASHETSGIRVDPTPPLMRYVHGGNLDGEVEEVINGYIHQNSQSTIQASWLGLDGQSGIKSYWIAVGTAPNSEDVRPFTSMGPKNDGVLSGLTLQLTDPTTCSDDEFTAACRPVYYVCVKSENGAGAFSDVVCSSPIRVVEEDQTGYVTDGPSMLQDIDAQLERTTVTIWFNDFESQLHGISHYEWAVGTTTGGEDIQPFTFDGIVPDSDTDAPGLAGQGKAQSPLPLQHGVTYYSTLRAITNGGNVLESTSNGFQVDITPPELMITELGLFDTSVALTLAGGVPLYQPNTDSIDATWDVRDTESGVVATYFSMGQYPGGHDIYPITPTNKSYVPLALITPADIGLPNILTVQAVNSVGLKMTAYTTSMTVDNTPPSVGQIQCPAFLNANSALLCSWSDFIDAESGIGHYRFLVGSAQGLSDVFQSGDLSGYLTHYSVRDLNLIHNKIYYVTVEAFNAINQSTLAFSSPIEIDDTPPTYGVVVELSGLHKLNVSDPFTITSPPEWDCSNSDECLSLDGECLVSITQLQILWEPFTDEDTRIVKYEVALGTTPGGSQIKPFYEVSKDQTSELVTNIDLSSVQKVYATVRGYNEAGLTSTAVSNGIYVSRFSAGLQPLRPFRVKDGVTESYAEDSDFQTSLRELSASWDFTGDPCPFTNYKWAIYRIDEKEIQPLTDVGDRTSDTNTDVKMTDGETYYTIVQATNALGLTVTVRSDGITVQRDPLIPGQVFDGLLVGFDLTSQKGTDTISASWNGFGQGMLVKQSVQHTGNAEVDKGTTTQQTVDYYEVAVGTDRRYPKTRDNVVPFTYVGKNTTVTFKNLDLTALDSTYYVTVRAHSASFATAEVTSTGIKVGVESTVTITDVEIPNFVNSLSEIQLQWDEFESTFPILLYYVGVGKPSQSTIPPEDIDCLDMLLVTDQSKATFSERQMEFVGKDTYVQVTGLNLTHKGSYYVTVVGMNEAGQCNSSTSYFSVDVTPPTEGRLRAGPFYDMPVAYTDSTDSISVTWEGYRDGESGLKSFNLRLVESVSCDVNDVTNPTPVPGQEWLVLGADIREFTFVDLSLVMNHPYFVQLLAINNAGDSVQTQVGPIFVDSSEPTPGLVVDGPDFMMDETDSGDRSQVTGTILHLPNPVGAPCPLRDVKFTDAQWTALDFNGLWNMNRDKWDIEYQSSQVFASDESVTLKMERDTRGPRMLSGAYVTNAQIVRSTEYEFDLKAAPPDLHSVTSVLFWDGPNDVIGEFDFPGSEKWQEGICQCCYLQPLNQSACPQCDCLDFLGITDENSTYSGPINEAATTQAPAQPLVMMTTVASPWAIREPGQIGENVDSDDSAKWTPQRACGFQLYPNGNTSQAVLWCQYFQDIWPMTSQHVDLNFDPSAVERHYSIRFKVTPFDANEDEWSFEVYVDGSLLSSLTGIPILTPDTKLILHVFNRDNNVAELLDPFNPPSVSATLRNLRMPPDQSELCRYGAPFRAGTSPVSRYFAGVGSVAGATDIVPFQEIARPCVPCINPCDRFQCDPACSMDATPITFTLVDLDLPVLELLNTTSENATLVTPSQDGLLYPFYLTVKSYLGNGKSTISSSNGFYIDDTPPVLDVFFYIDNSFNEFEPTEFQSSNSTIKVLWSFVDMQSEIKEHYWAIGTSRGSTDIQDYVNVGLNQTATNSGLIGLLHHNTTYYVTLKAVNGAGLETLVECDGVTVLLEQPSADDVNTTSLFSEKFAEEVYPPDVEKTTDPTKTGASWTESSDKSVTRYEFCVSSSADLLDDIIPCIPVGANSSGSVAIEGGLIIVRAGDVEERYSLTDFQIPKYPPTNTGTTPTFNMEPGKSLYNWMQLCNSAQICKTVSAGTTTIIEDGDSMMTSVDGEDIIMTSLTVQRRRRRRSVNSRFDFTVATKGGLHKGGSLIVGLLDANRTDQEFSSDAAIDYKPYITNPLYSIEYTSRLLRQRISFVYEPTFFITSLGQTKLRGPLMINTTLNAPGNWGEAKPRLLYWNKYKSEWHDAAKTCGGKDRVTYDQNTNQVNVEVCATQVSATPQSAMSRKRRAAEEQPVYFSHETQFALADVLELIPNNPPEITNIPENIFMNEDAGTLVYTFEASDPENDALVFELGQVANMKGTANITENGRFSFTPCADCNGRVDIQLIVREVQESSEIEPISSTVTISIDVRPLNDNPVVFTAQGGQKIGNGRIALVTVEQNTGANVAYKDLSLQLGAYDVDMSDDLIIVTQPPTFGTLTVMRKVNTMPLTQDCSQPQLASEELSVPCGLDLPHNKDDMSWAITLVTYTPNPNYHGVDSFLVLAEDSSGVASQLLEVQIAVLVNPCINNGTCSGPAEDIDCTSPDRSQGFDSYFCDCEAGWVGDTCETDYDECQSTPCEYPYVCYDQLDGFNCACPFINPFCDKLTSSAKVIIGVVVSLVILLIIIVILVILYRRRFVKVWRLHNKTADDDDHVSVSDQAVDSPLVVATGYHSGEPKGAGIESDTKAGCSTSKEGQEKPSGSGKPLTDEAKVSTSGSKKSWFIGLLNRSKVEGASPIAEEGSQINESLLKTSAQPSPCPSPGSTRWAEPAVSVRSSAENLKDHPSDDDRQSKASSGAAPEPTGSSESPKKDEACADLADEDKLALEMETLPSQGENKASQEIELPGALDTFKDFRKTDLLEDIGESAL